MYLSYPRHDTQTGRVVVVMMITDPVVVNTSPTNQPFSAVSTKFSLRQALTGPGGHSSKQLQKVPWPIRPAQIDGLGLPSTGCSGQLVCCCYITKSLTWPHNDECRPGDHDFTAQY